MCVWLGIVDDRRNCSLICVGLDITDKRGISTLMCVRLDFAHNKGIRTWNCRYLSYQDVNLCMLYTADNKGIRTSTTVRMENGDKSIRTSGGWLHPCILRTFVEYAWQLAVGKVVVNLDFETQQPELVWQIVTIFRTSGPGRQPIEELVVEDQGDAPPRMAHIVFFGVPFTARTFSWYGAGVGSARQCIIFPSEIIMSSYQSLLFIKWCTIELLQKNIKIYIKKLLHVSV